jgi:hypothetical protein
MLEVAPQRKFPRYPIQLPLLYKPALPDLNGKIGAGWTRNLSERGACIELAERLPSEAIVNLRLRTDRGPIQTNAQVVWTGERTPPSGGIPHGMSFTLISPVQSQALRDLLLPLSLAPHAGVRMPVDLPVRCLPTNPPGATLQGRTGDMSRGGLLLLLPDALAPGTTLEATLHTATGPLSVAGVIVWVEPPERRTFGRSIRHGMQFTSLDWSISLYLGLLLAELA